MSEGPYRPHFLERKGLYLFKYEVSLPIVADFEVNLSQLYEIECFIPNSSVLLDLAEP